LTVYRPTSRRSSSIRSVLASVEVCCISDLIPDPSAFRSSQRLPRQQTAPRDRRQTAIQRGLPSPGAAN
jgi:hypothetical protein